MGGRGSTSGKQSVSSALGKKTLKYDQNNPSDLNDIVSSTNSHYGETGYTTNCQRCVVAFEAKMQGYDVEALPNSGGDEYPRNYNWLKFFGKNVTDIVTPNGRTVRNPTVKSTTGRILSKMGEWGENSRAVLTFSWKDRDFGHVVSLVNTSKGVKIFDPQTGRQSSFEGLLGRVNLKSTKLVRTDDSNLNNPYIKDAVKPSL